VGDEGAAPASDDPLADPAAAPQEAAPANDDPLSE
jgi:hypothetical protein